LDKTDTKSQVLEAAAACHYYRLVRVVFVILTFDFNISLWNCQKKGHYVNVTIGTRSPAIAIETGRRESLLKIAEIRCISISRILANHGCSIAIWLQTIISCEEFSPKLQKEE